jgi:tRNA(Ile)-lysidine synthase
VAADPHLPITDVEADAAFASLARFDHVILAVSGGPDSMALMALAADWRLRRTSAPAISVATVDHGLRANSRSEAEMVAEAARRLGLSHVILTWDGPKPVTGLPMAAREARYRLLEDHAQAMSAETIAIVTAHHRDDQAETFAMRLARGAGIDGLSGMRDERLLRDGSRIVLARPLLAVPKARLVATLVARGIAYADDPTNADRRYERARVRSLLPELEAGGLSPQAMVTSARRLNDAREALRYGEEVFLASLALSFGNEVFARFDRRAFDNGPVFLRQKVMARLIGRYGGASPAPQLSEVEDLVALMQRDGASAATLGGAMISWGARFIRVWREAGRLETSHVELRSGAMHVWDRRFALRWRAERAEFMRSSEAPVITVKPLGEKGYAAIVSRLAVPLRPPARAAWALPSFWVGDEFIAAPSLAPFALSDAPPLDPAGFELNALATAAAF